MIITDIVPVTKQKYRVITNERLAFVLYKGELSRYQLEVDTELTEEGFEQIFQEVLVKRARLRAMHLLTKRDYTEGELYKKLLMGEYTQEAVEQAMDYVKSFHYLDDERYVRNYIRFQSERKSKRQIQFELEQKGIQKDIIAQYQKDSESANDKEKELIRTLLRKRCKVPETADEKEKNRHYMYLARKGFSSNDIRDVFREFF